MTPEEIRGFNRQTFAEWEEEMARKGLVAAYLIVRDPADRESVAITPAEDFDRADTVAVLQALKRATEELQ